MVCLLHLLREMRFNNIICALATLLYSCSDTAEFTPAEPQSNITFLTQSTTRGTLIGDASLLNDFGVYAYDPSGENPWLMEDVEVSRSGSVWSYSPTQVWPEDGYNTVEFYAYAPYTQIEVDTSGDIPYIYYDSPLDVPSQVDLMVGACSENGATGCVNVNFVHALAALNFRVSGSESSSVDSLVVEGITEKQCLKNYGV